jgi:hypothetical protein
MRRLLTATLLFGTMSVSLTAATITGQFTLVGTVTVTATGLIEWTSNSSPIVDNQATISSSSTLTGSFSGLGNQVVDINTLMDGPDPLTQQPVNLPFTNYNFIDFPSDPALPGLLANFMPEGSGGSSACSTNVALAAGGQTCTLNAGTNPSIPGGSPFTFLNTQSSLNQAPVCCTSSATWNISGVTSDGTANWNGQFTATFVVPFQEVLNSFVTDGQVQDAYSGVLVVDVIPIEEVPEPKTLGLMGAGLGLLVLLSWKQKNS